MFHFAFYWWFSCGLGSLLQGEYSCEVIIFWKDDTISYQVLPTERMKNVSILSGEYTK